MNTPDNNSSDFATASIAGVVGTVVGTVIMFGLVGLWTGTVSGPANPAFWQQAAPFAAVILVLFLLAIPPTRRVIFSSIRWVFGLRVLTRKQRGALASKEKQRPTKRASGIYGETVHGRLRSHRNMQNGVQHVKWRSNGAEVGTLTPGPRGGWNVIYNDTRETLGWADSKESGMEMLEAKGLAEH